MKIKDKVVIVTGASQGIGQATARYLAEHGAKVVLAARSKEKLEDISRELPDSEVIITDLRNPLEIKKMVEKTMDKYGRIDILINNVGQGMYGLLEDMDLEDYKKIMELNVYGPLLAMQEVIPIMKRQGGGMIVNVSSGVTKMYLPQMSAYSSSKYALNAISFIARQELAADNIVVSVVMPKMTSTNFFRNLIGVRPEWAGNQDVSSYQVDSPEKVAGKIAELIESEKPEISL
jgi:short-subunit dehydrogenase